ncbi:uncharacterized protein LOC142521325 [Primulina tabacum]|uniref:uncharacterized protein LOC142521325 n=1 Tax=Primulina tabacum TaxID=48773 RepID=UPI003F59E679
MLSPDEKIGRVDHPTWLINGFREVVATCGLTDLPLKGYPFTWARSKGTINAVEERIERALVNNGWTTIFPHGTLSNCTAPISDHSPILLTTENKILSGKRRGFRFKNKWLHEPGLSEVVRESWVNSSSTRLTDKLQYTADNLQRWGRKVSREFQEKIDRCKNKIDSSSLQNRSSVSAASSRTKLGTHCSISTGGDLLETAGESLLA